MALEPLVHTSSTPLIELKNVVKVFKTSAGEFYALRNVNLTFESGEFTSIMGKSGSGKSTLINMITGIDHPTSGSVRVGDVELQKMKEGQLAVWRGRAMGIVFQFFQLLPTLTILENTLLPMDYCNMYPLAEREGRALDLLSMLGLQDMADKLPAALSGGQQQIAAIARALANDPPIIIADEPTGNLDSQTEKLILSIFEDLASRGKTILIVTHDPALGRRSTRRVLISDGELVHEIVAQALPLLGHSQMLKITKKVQLRTFEPGVAIARRGAIDEGLYIVTSGTVQVTSDRRMRAPEVVGEVQVGGYFSEFELLESEYHELCYRASPDAPVKTLCLPQDDLSHLINESPAVEHVLRQSAIGHLNEYFPKAVPSIQPVEDRPVPAKRRWLFGGRK